MTMDAEGLGPTTEQVNETGAAAQADRCRRLARASYDRGTVSLLEQLAADFERHAAENDD